MSSKIRKKQDKKLNIRDNLEVASSEDKMRGNPLKNQDALATYIGDQNIQ